MGGLLGVGVGGAKDMLVPPLELLWGLVPLAPSSYAYGEASQDGVWRGGEGLVLPCSLNIIDSSPKLAKNKLPKFLPSSSKPLEGSQWCK